MSDNPEKCADYLKITRLVIDVGTDLARRVFYHFKPKHDVSRFFQSTTILDEIIALKRQNVLKPFQFDILVKEPNPDEFDISLLIILLTNLFKFTIENPKNGWSKDIDEDDTSLGADLMRLQSIRNFIVGHRPSARLSREDFEKLWKDTEDVLLRLAEFLGDEEKIKFQTEIESYKTAKLDDSSKLEEYYLDMLQRWHDEGTNALTELQNKVEYYLQKTEEFQVFFKKVPERYWRYILLLYEGGMTVMAALLKDLLISQQTDLESILQDNFDELSKSPSLADRIFVHGEIQTNIATWGLTTLSKVIQIVFASELDSMSAGALGDLKKAAENFAETALDSLDNDKFRTHWAHISYSINTLAIGLDKTTQLECFKLIRKLDSDEVDEEAAKMYVSLLQQDCHPFKGLIDMYVETREQLKHTVEMMIKEGVCFAKDHVVELKMMTFGEPEDKRKLAEDILYTVWNEAVAMTSKSGDFPEIKSAVEEILQVIRGIKGVHISPPERHCIILKIYFKTYSSLLEILKLLDENCLYWEHIGSCLSAVFKEQIIVTGFITVDSMQLIANMPKSDQKPDNKAVTLDINCSSVLAVQNLQEFLENNQASTAFTKISTKLSQEVKCGISVDITRNISGFDEVFNNPSGSLPGDAWKTFGLERSDDQVSTSSNMAHFLTTVGNIPTSSSRSEKRELKRKVKRTIVEEVLVLPKDLKNACLDSEIESQLDLISRSIYRMTYFYHILSEIRQLPLQGKWNRALPSLLSRKFFSNVSLDSNFSYENIMKIDSNFSDENIMKIPSDLVVVESDSSLDSCFDKHNCTNSWEKNISTNGSSSSVSSFASFGI